MAFPATRPQTDYQDDVLLLEEEQELRALVVYNDDVNTFDHVIQTLIDVCGHEPEQAEQRGASSSKVPFLTAHLPL